MYEDDAPLSGKSSRLSAELLKEVLFSTSLRPRIPRNLVENLEARLQRTAPGYAPRSADDLLDWTKERSLIPIPEWEALLSAVGRDHEPASAEAAAPVRDKILSIRLPGASLRVVCALETLDRIVRAFSTPLDLLDAGDVVTGERLLHEAPLSARIMTGDNGLPHKGEQDDRALSDIFLQWLSFYGPVRKSSLKEVLGLDDAVLDDLLADLVETEAIIFDLLTESAVEPEICDRENLEILLRMARRSRQPAFRAFGIDHLPLFLAAWQGLVAPGEAASDLQDCLDQLFGYPAAAEAWEKHILPARMSPYYSSWLDSLMQGSGLMWFGCGRKKLSFGFADDLELFLPQGGRGDAETVEGNALPDELSRLFPRRIGRYSLPDIVEFSMSDSRALTRKLWDLAWQGLVTNDTLAALRQGILTDFAATGLKSALRRPMRPGYSRWGARLPFPGNWHVLGIERMEKDSIDEAELVKDRVRQLFRRYGILFRELVAYELPLLQWAALFKALRLMELSGEILSGYFFEGIPGIQLISHEAHRFLSEPIRDDRVYWMNAVDPASLCGIRLDSLKGVFPSRIPSTHLVYRGKKPVLISRRNGSILAFQVPPDDPRILDYLFFFKVLLVREFNPEKIVTVETINGEPAAESGYARPLKEFGFSGGYKGLELAKRYT
jgi:ATP-dependent Lhr-like helicase